MTSAYFFGWDYTVNKHEKTTWQLVNRKADFLLNESIRIDSHNESNRIDSNRELECSNERWGDIPVPHGQSQRRMLSCHTLTAPLSLTRFSGSVRSAPNSAPLTCSVCDCMPARWCDCESTFNRAYIKIYLVYCSQVEIRKSATVQCSRLRIKMA